VPSHVRGNAAKRMRRLKAGLRLATMPASARQGHACRARGWGGGGREGRAPAAARCGQARGAARRRPPGRRRWPPGGSGPAAAWTRGAPPRTPPPGHAPVCLRGAGVSTCAGSALRSGTPTGGRASVVSMVETALNALTRSSDRGTGCLAGSSTQRKCALLWRRVTA